MYFQAAIKSRPGNLSSVKGDGSDDKNPREVERETEIMETMHKEILNHNYILRKMSPIKATDFATN